MTTVLARLVFFSWLTALLCPALLPAQVILTESPTADFHMTRGNINCDSHTDTIFWDFATDEMEVVEIDYDTDLNQHTTKTLQKGRQADNSLYVVYGPGKFHTFDPANNRWQAAQLHSGQPGIIKIPNVLHYDVRNFVEGGCDDLMVVIDGPDNLVQLKIFSLREINGQPVLYPVVLRNLQMDKVSRSKNTPAVPLTANLVDFNGDQYPDLKLYDAAFSNWRCDSPAYHCRTLPPGVPPDEAKKRLPGSRQDLRNIRAIRRGPQTAKAEAQKP